MKVKCLLMQGWPTIFTRRPFWVFICVKSNLLIQSLKTGLAGRMWPAGHMLPPPVLKPNLATKQNFLLQKALKSVTWLTKLKCHVLFEWLLTSFADGLL